MGKKRLLWQLYPSYLIIVILSLLTISWYMTQSLHRVYLEEHASELNDKAQLMKWRLSEEMLENEPRVDSLCKEFSGEGHTRITVILPSGKVIGDSEKDPKQMENHAGRPEVIEALAGRVGQNMRKSRTLDKDMMYLAIPFYNSRQEMIAIVRTSIPYFYIRQVMAAIYKKILIAGILITLFAAFICWIISRKISRPLEELTLGAQRFAQGELDHKLHIPKSQEIASLARAMNKMAAELDERISAMNKQRSEWEAVLSGMTEGVVAIDEREKIIIINKAAAAMLNTGLDNTGGRSVYEVIRNASLQEFIAKTFAENETIEGELILYGDKERFLRTCGTPLKNTQGNIMGAVVVLNDLTNIRKMENIRRDFVANVSHELKTPITVIKAGIETLIEEEGSENRFMNIIRKQSERLDAIIDDLLNLARIEQEAEKKEIDLAPGQIQPVLAAAIQLCEIKAREKNIKIQLICDEKITASINVHLMEQAAINLINNAIKYSNPGGLINVSCFENETQAVISVEDFGCGIEEKHLPRLFERFYRADNARSRSLGGTGLGLAIVKHIAQAHNGSVSVKSSPGKGSVFYINLPVKYS